jgi:hypothetical protein
VLECEVFGHERSRTCCYLTPLSPKQNDPSLRPVPALTGYSLRVGCHRQWVGSLLTDAGTHWSRQWGDSLLTDACAPWSVREMWRLGSHEERWSTTWGRGPLLYCACSDLGPQPMIGLCLWSRRVGHESLVAFRVTFFWISSFLDFKHFYPFSWDLVHSFHGSTIFHGCCGKPKRSPPTRVSIRNWFVIVHYN